MLNWVGSKGCHLSMGCPWEKWERVLSGLPHRLVFEVSLTRVGGDRLEMEGLPYASLALMAFLRRSSASTSAGNEWRHSPFPVAVSNDRHYPNELFVEMRDRQGTRELGDVRHRGGWIQQSGSKVNGDVAGYQKGQRQTAYQILI